jgi:hypothetical protein
MPPATSAPDGQESKGTTRAIVTTVVTIYERLESSGVGRRSMSLVMNAEQELLRGQWSDVAEIAYHPSADGYIKPRDEILGAVLEGV